jgi:hypothetical protein
MTKRSGGDIDKLEDLREQALKGAFDIRLCRGLHECLFIPLELRRTVEDAIRKFEEEGDTRSFKERVKKLKR